MYYYLARDYHDTGQISFVITSEEKLVNADLQKAGFGASYSLVNVRGYNYEEEVKREKNTPEGLPF